MEIRRISNALSSPTEQDTEFGKDVNLLLSVWPVGNHNWYGFQPDKDKNMTKRTVLHSLMG